LGRALESLANGVGVPILTVENLIDKDAQEKLGEHLSPILRWVKEFIALFATLVIGFVAITAYNAYKANADDKSFSFQDIGFFSKTDTVNKMEGVIDEYNHALVNW
jgi:predicted negative regulator of RcsB-dependent stress response